MALLCKLLFPLVHLGVHQHLVLEPDQLVVLWQIRDVSREHFALLPYPRQAPRGRQVEQDVRLGGLLKPPQQPLPRRDLIAPQLSLVTLGKTAHN